MIIRNNFFNVKKPTDMSGLDFTLSDSRQKAIVEAFTSHYI